MLWPESSEKQSIDNLFRLCKRIQKLPENIPLYYDKKTVWLDRKQIKCELYEFEQLYQNRKTPEACERALSLYRGMLFYEDCYEWSAPQEAYYDLRYTELLSCMAEHARQSGNIKGAEIYQLYFEKSD